MKKNRLDVQKLQSRISWTKRSFKSAI